MRKKLRLHRTTIAMLTVPQLGRVAGGYGGIPTLVVDTRPEPCERPGQTEGCTDGTVVTIDQGGGNGFRKSTP